MIADEVLGRFDQATRDNIKSALAVLHMSGVVKAQIELERLNMLIGSDAEPVADLAKRILEHRAKVNQLTELDSIGETYYREMNHNA